MINVEPWHNFIIAKAFHLSPIPKTIIFVNYPCPLKYFYTEYPLSLKAVTGSHFESDTTKIHHM